MKAITENFHYENTSFKSSIMHFGLLVTMILALIFTIENQANAQEMRANGHVIISGSGESLSGFGLGVEAPIGKLFSASVDVNYGLHRLGSAILVKPSLNFYFSKKQSGVFIGPTLNYFSLINKKQSGEERLAGTSMYGIGFNFGVKGNLTDKINMHVVFSPQGSIGSFNGVSLSSNIQMGIGFKF